MTFYIDGTCAQKQVGFATGNGKNYTHMWDDCNAIAKKAKVETNSRRVHSLQQSTWVKRHGSENDTEALRRTIESAMRYLARAQSKQVRKKVNDIFSGTMPERMLKEGKDHEK